MKRDIDFFNPRNILNSITHIIVAIIVLFILDIGISSSFNFVLYNVLIPFNGLSFLMKFFLFMIFGYFFFVIFLTIMERIITLFGGLIFSRIKTNENSNLIVYILAIINAIYNIVWICRSPKSYDFWLIIELIIISTFIWSLNKIVLPLEEQKEINEREDEILKIL
jgi:hypothetical protein